MKILIGLFVVFSFTVDAAPQQMVRFWRGYGQERSDLEGLRQKLNESFLKETVMVGAGRGLLAYMPVLFDRRNDPTIPDEVALVIYESKDKYDAIRATPRGKRYGDAHFSEGMFTRESRSQEAVPYVGDEVMTVQGPRAYVMQGAGQSWQSGVTLFRIMKPWAALSMFSVNEELKSLSNALGAGLLKSAVVLIDTNYLMEYIQVASPTEMTRALTLLSQSAGARWSVLYPTVLRPVPVNRAKLFYREGLSLWFDPTVMLTNSME